MKATLFQVDQKTLLNNLDRFQQSLKFREPIKDSLALLQDEIDRNFQLQGALYQGGGFTRPGGAFANLGRATTRKQPWKPLAPRTQEDRRRQGFPPKRPILIRTEKLRKGFKQKEISETQGSIVNDVFYARFHQTGTKIMPARRIVGVTAESRKAIGLLFAHYIAKEIKKIFQK